MKGLTTHVLDTLSGVPAAGVSVALYESDGKTLLAEVSTDAHGRCALADSLSVGSYEILFRIGNYFKTAAMPLPEPAFLDEVRVRFSVADAERHYHIPLVASPWSYTTYKGGAPSQH